MHEHPEPSLDEMRDHYDEWNSKWRQGGFEDIDPEIRIRGARVLELLAPMRGDGPRILEVGCGTGWLSERLAEIGEVVAIDLSPKAIEIARERGVPAELVAGDFIAHDFGPRIFDVVVLVETLFYIQDQPVAVEKVASLLRPGGTVALTCINDWVYERRSEIGPPAPGQLRHWLSIAEMRRLLAPRFDVLSVETLDPRGDLGLLRFVNSHKLNQIANRLFSEAAVRRWKERRGWGAGVVIVARKRASAS